jgi:uncharacterized protein YndB with AHSA1/START domain
MQKLENVTTTTSTADREIVATRLFHAPRGLVFKMWTDRDHISNWWGPRGFTTTTYEMDVRPGGVWRFVMHGPDGRDYQNKIIYREIVAPGRISYFHESPPPFDTTVTFMEQDGGTLVTARLQFESAELREAVAKAHGAVEGLNQTLARLDEEVSKMAASASDGEEFVISREFDAPRDLVFKAWTESERLAEWWGPKGFKIRVVKFDLRPGGTFLYRMTTPNGEEWWGKFVYREIVPPERIVWVNSFSDPQGGVTRHPKAATMPFEMLSTATFTERDGRTTLTLRQSPINATAEERATFAGMRESMQKGWGGTLDQLAEFLKNG